MNNWNRNQVRDDSIWRGIFYMGIGTVVAQLVNIIIQPVLTRIFPVSTLGIYTYIISIASVIIPIASLKMDMLIVSEKDEVKAQYITDVCILLNVLTAFICFIIIFIGYQVLNCSIFNKYGYIIYLIPLIIITNGIRFLFISYNNRYKQYKLISKIGIFRECARAIIQIVSVFFSFGLMGLTLGYVLAPVFGIRLQMHNYIWKMKYRQPIRLLMIKDIIWGAGARQIIYLVPSQFVNSFSFSLVIISITSLFSADTLGYYSIGVRILDIPIMFITANVSKVIYQRISENVSKGQPILGMIKTVAIVLSGISFAGFTLLYISAPYLTNFVFGNGYSVAGYYIRCFCVMYAFRLVTTSFNGISTIFRKQYFELLLNIGFLVFGGIAYVWCYVMNLDVLYYLWIIGISYACLYIVLFIAYFYICIKYEREL